MKAPAGFSLPVLACAAALVVSSLRAVELPATSPFLPASAAAAPAVPVADTGGIEFRGVIPTPAGPLFSIYNTVRRTSTFVALNEPGTWGTGGASFVVRGWRQVGDQDQVTVEYQGRSLTLLTKKSAVGRTARGGPAIAGANPAAPGAGIPAPVNPAPAAVTQNVTLNPTTESEARRLQDVADEINRRREQRAQNAGPGNAPAARGNP
jgi:hypothetical protein